MEEKKKLEEIKKPKEYSPKVVLSRVELEGYKSIRYVDINLHDGLNIIIGNNGAGKSNFLNFLHRVINLDFFNINKVKASLFLNREDNINYKIYLENDNSKPRTEFDSPIKDFFVFREKTAFKIYQNDKMISEGYNLDEVDKKYLGGELMYSCQLIRHTIPENLLFIDIPLSFKIFYKSQSEITSLLFKENIPYFLKNTFSYFAFINENDFESGLTKDFILENLSEIYDLIKPLEKYSPIENIKISDDFNIHVEEKTGDITISNLFLLFKINDQWLPFSSLSDGTKRLFYIIAEVAFSSRYRESRTLYLMSVYELSRIILLEEPELGIHPHQLDKLLEFLKEQSKHKQIIITTHSPQVLDILQKDELNRIIIAEMGENGTTMRHLTEKEEKKAAIYMEDEGFLSDYWRFSDLNE